MRSSSYSSFSLLSLLCSFFSIAREVTSCRLSYATTSGRPIPPFGRGRRERGKEQNFASFPIDREVRPRKKKKKGEEIHALSSTVKKGESASPHCCPCDIGKEKKRCELACLYF